MKKNYWLPPNVKVKEPLPEVYNKETKLTFIDSEYGEFISTFRAMMDAGGVSMHPVPKAQRQKEKMIKISMNKWGVDNPSKSIEVVQKRVNNMRKNNTTTKNPEIAEKRKQTNLKKFGHECYSQTYEFQQKQKYDNCMQKPEYQEKLKQSFYAKYGVDNPSKTKEVVQKIMESRARNPSIIGSKEENEVRLFIQNELGLKCTKKYFGGENPCEIDVMVEDLKIGIEYHGIHWHSDACRENDYHYNKMITSNNHGYRLIQIFSNEWKDRKYQVKSFLRSALNKNERTIYARKCTIEMLSRKESKEFFDQYHILGRGNYKYSIGLKHQGELVAAITVGYHHRTNVFGRLNRFVGKYNTTVVGGLSRLCKYAYTLYGQLSTSIDLRWSTGKSWETLGWNIIENQPIDYFYYNPNTKIIKSKQSRSKKIVGTPSFVKEREHSILDGFERVYDCGKLTMVYGEKKKEPEINPVPSNDLTD